MATKKSSSKSTQRMKVEAIVHDEAKRKNIPTAEYQSIMQHADRAPLNVLYARRNRDLDPQLVWRGKDAQELTDLVVAAPPLYIQEKVHPKVLIDDLMKKTSLSKKGEEPQIDLFSDFNGLPSEGAKTEFYQHESHWSNRMIVGDSLQVMTSLAEREGLRGKVQCIYFDPPYGIRFNSNFQWSTTTRTVDDKAEHITREPEQVKAFRDTWQDGIHSYLTHIRDRLTVMRDLLSPSGSVFIQIGDANVHRLRTVCDEVFGDGNFIAQISVRKTATPSLFLDDNHFFVLWYAKKADETKYRKLLREKPLFEWVTETRGGSWGLTHDFHSRPLTSAERANPNLVPNGSRIYALSKTTSAGGSKEVQEFEFEGKTFSTGANTHWKTSVNPGMERVKRAGRLEARGGPPWFKKYHDDSPFKRMTNVWDDTSGKSTERIYVVQTEDEIVKRCVLMASDPGDLVLDPTCGSGTTAFVAEQWGRRWITIDTSRVALALARSRIMGARFPYYILADSREGQIKEGEITRTPPASAATYGNIRLGFVYERVPYVTLKSISSNAEIDVIWEKHQKVLEPIRTQLNAELKKKLEEWEIKREAEDSWSEKAKRLHQQWWVAKIERQSEMDASIAAKAEAEYLYDKPFVDKGKVRVSGPFTVESVSPHKVLALDDENNLIRESDNLPVEMAGTPNFTNVILENLKTAGVQQAHKADKINFTSMAPWPGQMICAEAVYTESGTNKEKRAAIFVGPEFGTVSRPDLVEAAKEAGDADFDILIACAFNFDARSADFATLGRIPILKARMNADLHMADDLKNTGKGNLFVVFGEPDIEIKKSKDDLLRVKINGVDVFHPNTGEVKSDGPDGIACWFLDTDYNEESFFVRHAYFLGASDPYKALRSSLKAEISESAWESLHSDVSRPFEKPHSGRIAVKVINHLGDEVMKVFKVN